MKALFLNWCQPALIGLLCTGLQLGTLAAKDLVEEIHKTFPLNADGQVQLDNVNGRVLIEAWDRAEVKIDAVKRAGNQDDLDALKIEISAKGDRITIHTKYPKKSGWSWKGSANSVDYELKVPAHAELKKIETVNGSVEIEGVYGGVHASTVNGRVTAKGLAADCKLETVNGAIEATFYELDAKSVSLETVNGGVDLILPSTANADVRASTVHGGITGTSELRVIKNRPGRELKGQLGSGGTAVKIQTVNGAIRVRQSEPQKVTRSWPATAHSAYGDLSPGNQRRI